MQARQDYSFRNRELCAYTRLCPTENIPPDAHTVIDEGWQIVLPRSDSRLVRYLSGDLYRFFSDALGLCLHVRFVEDLAAELASPFHKILLCEEAHIGRTVDSEMAGAFHLTVTAEHILIVGKTERGTAQGAYYLEDRMALYGAPLLPHEEALHAPLFSPRMTHSGTELDTFPDDYLAAVAHAGMDAIIVYAGHPDSHLHGFPDPDALWPGTGRGYCDFANLAWRAAGYGLDVYIYSQLICDRAPSAPDAWDYYNESFGRIFREAPALRGLILVGESFEFPSRDPHTCGTRVQLRPKGDTRPSSGRYPSEDYPEMLSLVRDVVRSYTPDADIIFWSYNFGWTPRDARLSLIERLPRDISYLVTFEVWERLSDERGRKYSVADYSISYPGPCRIFCEEAEKAHACGLRLYTMGNTGGRTWDLGGAAYTPAPGQWQKRYDAIKEARARYGLSGLMENHHYGWMPSFLTLYAKNAFLTNGLESPDMLTAIARRDYGREYERALAAWACFDAGMAAIIPSVTDQYGPFRAGPAYPLTFTQTQKDLKIPYAPWAWHRPGTGIWRAIYPDAVLPDIDNTLLRLERASLAAEHFGRGCDLLAEAVAALGAPYGSEISRQLALCRYHHATFITARNVIAWTVARVLLFALGENTEIPRAAELLSAIGVSEYTKAALAAHMRRIAAAEAENTAYALAAYREDSLIGFEASMEYTFNEELAAWKTAECRRSLDLLDAYMAKNQNKI